MESWRCVRGGVSSGGSGKFLHIQCLWREWILHYQPGPAVCWLGILLIKKKKVLSLIRVIFFLFFVFQMSAGMPQMWSHRRRKKKIERTSHPVRMKCSVQKVWQTHVRVLPSHTHTHSHPHICVCVLFIYRLHILPLHFTSLSFFDINRKKMLESWKHWWWDTKGQNTADGKKVWVSPENWSHVLCFCFFFVLGVVSAHLFLYLEGWARFSCAVEFSKLGNERDGFVSAAHSNFIWIKKRNQYINK